MLIDPMFVTGLYHGCPTCFPDRDLRVASNLTMEERYQMTLDKQQFVESKG